MQRWGIILNGQLLFATDDEIVARRFMVMTCFQIIDHASGYYMYMDQCGSDPLIGESSWRT